MAKEHTLESLRMARASHEEQMKKIQTLMSGKFVDELTALSKYECKFGRWLYSESEYLQDILGDQFYSALEDLHSKWHEQYHKVYRIFYDKSEKKSFFATIFNAAKIEELDKEKTKVYHRDLLSITKELLAVMGSCERRVSALPDFKFR